MAPSSMSGAISTMPAPVRLLGTVEEGKPGMAALSPYHRAARDGLAIDGLFPSWPGTANLRFPLSSELR
jgi:hypothetical protein